MSELECLTKPRGRERYKCWDIHDPNLSEQETEYHL